DRPRRIGLRPSEVRHGRQRGSACGQMQKFPSVGKFHFEPSLSGAFHSITSSARASSVSGTARPSAFAVVKLMTRSNLVGCSTGMSASARSLSALNAGAMSFARRISDLQAELAGRCLGLAHFQYGGGIADIGHDRQPAKIGDDLAQEFESL